MESLWIELYNRTQRRMGLNAFLSLREESGKSEYLELVLSRTAKVLLLWSDLRRSWL